MPAFQRGYVAGRANSMRHEYHVSQRLVGVLVEQKEGGGQVPLVLLVPLERERRGAMQPFIQRQRQLLFSAQHAALRTFYCNYLSKVSVGHFKAQLPFARREQ